MQNHSGMCWEPCSERSSKHGSRLHDDLRHAQLQRDHFVPEKPPGNGRWCPDCGRWMNDGETSCRGCLRRQENWRIIRQRPEDYLGRWPGAEEAYRQRWNELLRRGDRLGLLAMEQAEAEFAESIEEGGKRDEATKQGYHIVS